MRIAVPSVRERRRAAVVNGALSPTSVGGSPVSLHLYVEDVDRIVAGAAAAGATVLRPVKDEFYGDRTGMIADPFGHKWQVATPVEDVSPERDAAALERDARLISAPGVTWCG